MAEQKKVIAVVGATGAQGGGVVRAILADRNGPFRARALTRHPESDKGKALAPFTIARVISAQPHPNADRLRVCMVDTGSGDPVQVVCGAPNARTGMTGVFVPPGAFVPGKGITLQVGTIRGVESRGMLVSEAELQISDDHDGIIDLPADAPLGVSFAKYAGLDDAVIDINLTPNRPDCTGVNGVARDLAAAEIGRASCRERV